MKRLMMFALVICIVLPIIFTGCKDPELESMTFVNGDGDKEFTIYEDLSFKVTFVAESEFLDTFEFMVVGDWVSGKVAGSSNSWLDDVITGKSSELSTGNEELDTILSQLNDLGGMDFKIEYTKQNGDITAVDVSFPASDDLSTVSNTLMGGKYNRK